MRERLGLTAQELLQVLDDDKVVDIGAEPNTHRMHRLLYDRVSGHYFVVVQDTRNREVVTVLPLDYHNRCSWQVDQNLMGSARALIATEGVPAHTPPASVRAHIPTAPKFLVRVCYVRSGKLVRHRLASVDPGKYGGDLTALLADSAFAGDVLAQLRDAGLSSTDVTATLAVRLGQKGDPKVVPLFELVQQSLR